MTHDIYFAFWLMFWGIAFGSIVQPELAVADDVPTTELPITRVVLFNSGVGFYEHNGKIDGTRRVELKFRTEDVNDLLKSIVLQDLGGGQVSAVTYKAREPLAHTLKTFRIDLTQNPTLADLLEQGAENAFKSRRRNPFRESLSEWKRGRLPSAIRPWKNRFSF